MKLFSFIQAFNAMRIFFQMQYDQTNSESIGTLCGDFNLWKDKPDWKENPDTFDPSAWQDWIDGVNKLIHDTNNITQDPKKLLLNEETAFLCMQNCLQFFYDHTPWKDILTLHNKLQHAQHSNSDPVWQEWLQAINHSINETYALDVYFDPFTGERMQ